MNRLFDDVDFADSKAAFHSATSAERPAGPAHREVTETDDTVRIMAELPGMDEKDVEVLMHDGALTIRGETKSETEDKARSFSPNRNRYGLAASIMGNAP